MATMEDEIIMRLEEQGAKYFIDVDFNASTDCLYRNKSVPPTYAEGDDVKWLRPHEIVDDPDYFKDSALTGDVVLGKLDTGYFLSAVAMLAASSDSTLLEDLFGSGVDDFKKYGVYTCRFYKNGQWVDVITDTRLPCYNMSPVYSRCADVRELYLPLLEKAYAKFHGTYESLNRGSIAEALVDLTGGSCDKINLSSMKVKESISRGFLWDEVVSFSTAQNTMGCSISDTTRDTESTPETAGLLKNLAYPILECREVQASTGIIQFVKLRNPWGDKSAWTGDWGHGSNKWDDYPEVHSELRGGGGDGFAGRNSEEDGDQQGHFWITFQDLCAIFTKLYVCKTFADEKGWRQYCMSGDWVGKTAGGAPSIKGLSDLTTVLPESDAFWFNNPQFQIRLDTKSKVRISLMQQDRRIRSNLHENYPIAFEVVRQKRITADLNRDHPRVWDLDGSSDLVVDSTSTLFSSNLPQREVSAGDLEFDPIYVYNIIPHPSQRQRGGKFFLRVFSNNDLVIEQIAETNSLYLPGSWEKIGDRDSCGGGLRCLDEKASKVKDNNKWCLNPQFLLTTVKPRTAYDDDEPGAAKSVDIKIVVRRTDGGGKNRKNAKDIARKTSSTTAEKKQPTLGMVICRAPMTEKDSKLAAQRRRQQDAKINALGQRLPTKESSLKAQRKKLALQAAKEAEMTEATGGGMHRRTGDFDEGGDGLDEMGGAVGGWARAEKTSGNVTDRKMTVNKEEWSVCSDYSNTDVSSIFMKKVDVDMLSDGLLIVPSLSDKGVKGGFTLEIHSDFAVKVEELPEARSKTITGEWTEGTGGGSHLNPDWKKNPRFNLKLNTTEPANVKIVLSRNEKSWVKECTKDSIGCMMGFYLMQGPKPNRDMGNIFHDGKPWGESPFVPLHSVSTPEGFMLQPLPDGDVYSIMPTTFDPAKKGSFFLSVVTDVDFTLSSGSGSSKSDKGMPRKGSHKKLEAIN
ncbi:hypothetical protein TrCOL_g11080 [Triparma columacea]|uniref:Calpain catalytic domain-containing protein n=1 Tax=Triparma columacea TaxID=722753 RepID=A0A9W7GJT3_9STRA|nr:hypothetical protein TrCOL_g11080 [Triparma columacea]